MKKILLGTTALIGAATLLAGAASAGEDPKVTVGGFSTFEAAYSKSDFDGSERKIAFRNDNEIHFNVAGKTDAGLGYGAEIDLQADISGDQGTQGSTNSGVTAHRTYGWLQGDTWGHVEYGSNDGVARTLKVDASNIARATGGIDGDWYLFADYNNTAGTPTQGTSFHNAGGATAKFITTPRLTVESGGLNTFASDVWSNDTKITYYTPRFSGFQLGVSYAPSLSNRGQLTNRTDTATGITGAGDIWEEGLNYEGQFDQVGIAAGVTGEEGKSNDSTVGALKLNDIKAWNAGLKLSYMGFSAAGSYGDLSDSFDVNGTKADYWTGGLAYETGPLGASVTYLYSEDKNTGFTDKFQDVSVGVDYKLAPGLTPFIEYTWYDIDPTGSPADAGFENKGNIVIVGSELSF
jgi:outer membrane protein OmpU